MDLNAGDLNAGRQISLSCLKEVLKLTHCVHIVWKPGWSRAKVEQGKGDQHNTAPSNKHSTSNVYGGC